MARRFTIPAASVARVGNALQLRVFFRDGFACVYCGAGGPVSAFLQVDHARPLAHFPSTASSATVNDPANLVTACADCNGAKGPQDQHGFARMLLARGVAPREVRALRVRVRRALRRPLM